MMTAAEVLAALDPEELQCLLLLGLARPERVRLARVGVLPPGGTSFRLARLGLCIRIAVDPAHYKGDPGVYLATDPDGAVAIIELTARGHAALRALGSTRRAVRA